MPQKRTIPRTCQQCGNEFLARPRDITLGKAQFCSWQCYLLHRGAGPSEQRICLHCGTSFLVRLKVLRQGGGKYCSPACGAKRPQWRGARWIDQQGYVWISLPDGRRRKEHRVVMETVLGRPLRPREIVHHRNNIPTDNRPENLEVMSQSTHGRLHNVGRVPTMGWSFRDACCKQCGTTERRHKGHGLCATCYYHHRHRKP